jgi:hypothetical protein
LHFHILGNDRAVEPIFAEVGHALKEGDCVTSRNVPPLTSDRFESNDDFDQATPIDVNMKYDLLDFAMQWAQFSLFNEKTMKIKPAVLEAKRQAMAAEAR